MDKDDTLSQAIWVATSNIAHFQDLALNSTNYSARKMAEYLLAVEQEKLASLTKEKIMSNVYVEARPKGRAEGTPIDDYVVEDHADHVLGTFKTQKEGADWAIAAGHSPLIARVRHLNDKKKPDHWRAA